VKIPHLGDLEPYPHFDEWLVSAPFPIPLLRGHHCRFVFDAGEGALVHAEALGVALGNMLRLQASALAEVQHLVFQYCREMLDVYEPADRPAILVRRAEDVWQHVAFGSEFHVSLRSEGDDEDGIYFSLECNCAWEPEHGLQIVIRDGLVVTKVGPFDGHLTNSDAFADHRLKGVVYKSLC
jgi:hypothetical protein